MEINQRERSAETATQLMKAFGIKSVYSMWPDLTEILKDVKVYSEQSGFMNATLGTPFDAEPQVRQRIHDEEVIDAEFDVAGNLWEELDLEED